MTDQSTHRQALLRGADIKVSFSAPLGCGSTFEAADVANLDARRSATSHSVFKHAEGGNPTATGGDRGMWIEWTPISLGTFAAPHRDYLNFDGDNSIVWNKTGQFAASPVLVRAPDDSSQRPFRRLFILDRVTTHNTDRAVFLSSADLQLSFDPNETSHHNSSIVPLLDRAA